MTSRRGRGTGGVARRAVFGAVAAWFAAVGGVAGVAWLAIQSAGYAVTGSRLVATSLDAPADGAASRPTVAATVRPASPTSISVSRPPSPTRSGRPAASAATSVPAGGAGPGANTAGGQGSHGPNGGAVQGGGSTPGGGGPIGGQGTSNPVASGSGHNGAAGSTPPSTPVTGPSSSTSSSAAGSGATSQWTPGGLVVAECDSDTLYWSVEPANGWTTLQSQKLEQGVRTGFRRSGRIVSVTITCDRGTPAIDVRTTSDASSD